jgi:hypothetical protein
VISLRVFRRGFIAEDLALTPGFFMAGSASGRRFDFGYLFPLLFGFKRCQLTRLGNGDRAGLHCIATA